MTDASFRTEVLAGLSRPQKALSPKWLYDRRGSELFEEIVGTPDYYPPEAEAIAFKSAFPAAGERFGGAAIAEFGSGASVKTDGLIEAVEPCLYVPIDIAADFLRDSAAAFSERFPGLPVEPVVGDFTRKVALPERFTSA
jgi:L-histidine N-alpha-methyltransferase